MNTAPPPSPAGPAPARIARGVAALLGLAGAAWLATGLFAVQPGEQAAVFRCGRLLAALRGPGLHAGLPAGIDRIVRLRMQEPRRVAVGATLAGRASGRDAPALSECLTGDRNLVNASAVVQYRIADARSWLLSVRDPDRLVSDAAGSALSARISAMTVDELLTVRRIELQDAVRGLAQASLDRFGAGVQIDSVTLESVSPPQEVAEAFREVAAAREDRQRAINEAEGYANRLIPESRGEAERLRLAAQAGADEMIQRARGEADSFRRMAAGLAQGRELTCLRLVLEAAEEILPRLNKVVVDGAARERLDLGLLEERP